HRQRGDHEPSADAAVGVGGGVPATLLVRLAGGGAFVLGVDQDVAHALMAGLLDVGGGVPLRPVVGAHVVHDLGGVVVVIDGAGVHAAGHGLLQLADAVDQVDVARAPAEIFAAEQADRRHGRCRLRP